MAISEPITGTETVSTTEWSLATDTSYSAADAQTDDGVYELCLDLSALAIGDKFEFRLWEKVSSGGTQRRPRSWVFAHAQTNPHPILYLGVLIHGWDVSAIKVAGTDRSISWSFRKVA